MEGLKEANVARETDIYLSNPVLPDEILQGQSVCIPSVRLGHICIFYILIYLPLLLMQWQDPTVSLTTPRFGSWAGNRPSLSQSRSQAWLKYNRQNIFDVDWTGIL